MGKGGYRGRWRSFQTGYPGVVYSTALDEERARVKLVLQGTDHQRTYTALIRHQAEIDARLDQTAKWHQGDRSSWLGLGNGTLGSRAGVGSGGRLGDRAGANRGEPAPAARRRATVLGSGDGSRSGQRTEPCAARGMKLTGPFAVALW